MKICNNNYTRHETRYASGKSVPTRKCHARDGKECGRPWFNECPKLAIDGYCAWIISNPITAFDNWVDLGWGYPINA